jgi:hypothetical protein
VTDYNAKKWKMQLVKVKDSENNETAFRIQCTAVDVKPGAGSLLFWLQSNGKHLKIGEPEKLFLEVMNTTDYQKVQKGISRV